MAKPSKPATAAPLDRDRVVAAALELIDEVGMDAFTMRALASRLNTFPATVYWHAGNRDAVLALVVDRALAEIRLPDTAKVSWQDWLVATANEYRRVLHRHPNIAPIVATQVVVSPPSLPVVEAVLAVLARAGFSGRALTDAYNTFVGSLLGWVSIELAQAPREPEGWQGEFEQTLGNLDSSDYPVLTRNRRALVGRAFALRWQGGAERPMDPSFRAAVRVWVLGLAAVAPQSGAPRSEVASG